MNNHKPSSKKYFIVFLLASLIATIGSGMTAFGISVYIFEQTHSVTLKSMISLVAFLPTILLTPFAGALADRYDRRVIMILGDSLSIIGVLIALFGIIYDYNTYTLIIIGVLVSAIFSSLIEPASRATITDLVPQDQYTKASGLLQLIGSARFLISPMLAAFIMTAGGIESVLIIDILTIFTTIAGILYIRQGLESQRTVPQESITQSMVSGYTLLKANRGIYYLVIFSIVLTFMVGLFQELSVPMLLSFASRNTLSVVNTIAASGMLISALFIGSRELKSDKLLILTSSIFIAGIAMAGFGFKENIILVTLNGFLFFVMIPFMNSIMDYFVRVNIPNEVQGRVWGMIGTISQFGYIIAYASAGLLADYVFRPLLEENGILANTIGRIIGVGSGRGIGLIIILAGIILSLFGLLMYKNKDIQALRG